MKKIIFHTLIVLGLSFVNSSFAKDREILNVSYDPTRELYKAFNEEFIKYWEKEKGEKIIVNQSHAGSGKQARAVIDGLEADVVTLALAQDVGEIAKQAKLMPLDWQKRLKDNSTPYTSTIVFLVRKGNPKGIKDWDDLVKDGVSVITPNPKTSGGAKWNYLAAWGFALKKYGNSEEKAKEFVRKLFKNVPVLDTGARGSTITFAQRGLGDVLVTWENEAFLALKEGGEKTFEIVTPSISILAEPTVSLVDKNVEKHKTKDIAESYLNFLYTEVGQDIAAKWYYRPRMESVQKKYESQFPKLNLITIDDEMFGGWDKVQEKHFREGGIFDEFYK